MRAIYCAPTTLRGGCEQFTRISDNSVCEKASVKTRSNSWGLIQGPSAGARPCSMELGSVTLTGFNYLQNQALRKVV